MQYSQQVIVKRWIPILKEYERTKAKVNPRPFKFVKNLCEAHHISKKELGRYYRKWIEGHRGWINYLAVYPKYQRKGYGRLIMEAVERRIKEKGCPRINLQARSTNKDVIKFYQAIGYTDDNVVGLGKRFEEDEPYNG